MSDMSQETFQRYQKFAEARIAKLTKHNVELLEQAAKDYELIQKLTWELERADGAPV